VLRRTEAAGRRACHARRPRKHARHARRDAL